MYTLILDRTIPFSSLLEHAINKKDEMNFISIDKNLTDNQTKKLNNYFIKELKYLATCIQRVNSETSDVKTKHVFKEEFELMTFSEYGQKFTPILKEQVSMGYKEDYYLVEYLFGVFSLGERFQRLFPYVDNIKVLLKKDGSQIRIVEFKGIRKPESESFGYDYYVVCNLNKLVTNW